MSITTRPPLPKVVPRKDTAPRRAGPEFKPARELTSGRTTEIVENAVLRSHVAIDGDLIVGGNLTCEGGRWNLKVSGNIRVTEGSISAADISARNIVAKDIAAQDIKVEGIIDAMYILAASTTADEVICQSLYSRKMDITSLITNREIAKRESD